jgi:small subunit ribosomal protein S2
MCDEKGEKLALPTLKDLLEAGAHFGHQTRRWNPKMGKYIFGARGGVHIIDLTHTAAGLEKAVEFAHKVTEDGGKILFVGTKRQASGIIKDEAEKAGMPYVTERWLGGMLTNFRTIRTRVNRLKQLESGLESGDFATKYNKKEVLDFTNEAADLNRIFGGIKDMDELPKAMLVVDAVKEDIAIAEANTLNIPVIAITDSNANPDLVSYIIPGNDDAIKAVRLITHAIADAAANGATTYMKSAKQKAEASEEPTKA